jgi:transcription elongation factor GreA
MNNKISDESPVGMALKGARVGKEVTVEAPDGDFKYRVMEIKRAI